MNKMKTWFSLDGRSLLNALYVGCALLVCMVISLFLMLLLGLKGIEGFVIANGIFIFFVLICLVLGKVITFLDLPRGF